MQLAILRLWFIKRRPLISMFREDGEEESAMMQGTVLDGVIEFGNLNNDRLSPAQPS